MVPLRQELDTIRAYLTVQQLRFAEKLNVITSVRENTLDLPIMKLLVQPLVENAVHHGIEPKSGCGTLYIGARQEADRLLISVYGASGDTELFEKASNINGFQGGRVANNLYISPFGATVFQTAALFLYPNSSGRDLGGKSAFSFAVACVLNMTWVFSHAGGSGGSQTDKPLKINTFHFHRKEVRRWLYSVSKRPGITRSCPTTICGICRCR